MEGCRDSPGPQRPSDSQSDVSQESTLSQPSQSDLDRQNPLPGSKISPGRNSKLRNKRQSGHSPKLQRDPTSEANFQSSQNPSPGPSSGQNPKSDATDHNPKSGQNSITDPNSPCGIKVYKKSSSPRTSTPKQNLKIKHNKSDQRVKLSRDSKSTQDLPPIENLQLNQNPMPCNQNQPSSQEQSSTQNDQNLASGQILHPIQGSSSSPYKQSGKKTSTQNQQSPSKEDSDVKRDLPSQGVKRFEDWLYCSLCQHAFSSSSATKKHRTIHHARYRDQKIIFTCYAEVRYPPKKKTAIVNLDFTQLFPYQKCYRCEKCDDKVLVSRDEKIRHISNVHSSYYNELLDIYVPLVALDSKHHGIDSSMDYTESSDENDSEVRDNNIAGPSGTNNANTSQRYQNESNESRGNTSYQNSDNTSGQCADSDGDPNSFQDDRTDEKSRASDSRNDTAIIRCNNCLTYFTCLNDHVNCGSKLTPSTVTDCELCGFIFSLTAHHARIDHKNDRACQFRQKRSPFLEKILEEMKQCCYKYHVPWNNDERCEATPKNKSISMGGPGKRESQAQMINLGKEKQ